MRLVWSEQLRCGIREIDLQHQGFIEIVNDLDDFCHGNPARASLDQILAQLTVYAEFHFETEDALMGSYLAEDSSHLIAHTRAHARFSERIQAFRARPEAERLAAASELLDHLEHWLLHHIMGSDKDMAALIDTGYHEGRNALCSKDKDWRGVPRG